MDKPQEEKKIDWKRPDQVMKLHKLKLRKFALQARFNRPRVDIPSVFNNNNIPFAEAESSRKRKNPFAKNESNKKPKASFRYLEDISNASTFGLLGTSVSTDCTKSQETSDLLDRLALVDPEPEVPQPQCEAPKGNTYIPIDWTLKTKLRIMSPTPFSWNGKFKASEQASGTTAYGRCLNIGEQPRTLDTTPNARFYKCCLVWQYPCVPGLEMFPRAQGKLNASSNNIVAMNQVTKDAFHEDWCGSFRSLFHLLRVGQCPYFYACGNSFTVLFRAAGICGISEVQALLTPSTRGLREALKKEDIRFTMPLKSKEKKHNLDPDEISAIHDDDDDELNDTWLKSVGIEESEIRKIGFSQTKVKTGRECDVDNSNESLVFVTGVEVQGLFNFLINCKTIMTCVGPYSGIPPTLLAPVFFLGAGLRQLKVRESTVSNGAEKYHSLELTGPILPDMLRSLCSLMASDGLEKFSVSSAEVTGTIAFTLAKNGTELETDETTATLPQSVFGLENLTDCGLGKDILGDFCNPDPSRFQHFESLTSVNALYQWS